MPGRKAHDRHAWTGAYLDTRRQRRSEAGRQLQLDRSSSGAVHSIGTRAATAGEEQHVERESGDEITGGRRDLSQNCRRRKWNRIALRWMDEPPLLMQHLEI